jgi:GTP cyclohydrolase I
MFNRKVLSQGSTLKYTHSVRRSDSMSTLKTNGNGNGSAKRKLNAMPIIAKGNTAHKIEVVNFEDIAEGELAFDESYEPTEILTGDKAQFDKIQQAVFQLLDAFNVNWDDPNYTETPKRVAEAYLEYWASGYGRRPEDEITVFPNTSKNDDFVLVKEMKFYSLCSHHLAPFHGYGAIAYIPDEKLLGLSKLGRILDIYARRFQLQERVGAQTADTLMRLLNPKGVMVILYDTEHMCMSSRGVKLHEANTTTIAARGIFETDKDLRREVLSLLQK